jgi:hypothetical protein
LARRRSRWLTCRLASRKQTVRRSDRRRSGAVGASSSSGWRVVTNAADVIVVASHCVRFIVSSWSLLTISCSTRRQRIVSIRTKAYKQRSFNVLNFSCPYNTLTYHLCPAFEFCDWHNQQYTVSRPWRERSPRANLAELQSRNH